MHFGLISVCHPTTGSALNDDGAPAHSSTARPAEAVRESPAGRSPAPLSAVGTRTTRIRPLARRVTGPLVSEHPGCSDLETLPGGRR
ncbi:hypothetical protein M3T53_01450 [Actinomyces sp. B33]|uniref:hypothetical protein n=1 Tax=Actinomyces sp. B33 TaxID=2942131 RepID=UPI0023426C4E|nr:hypothetical protein [Actinomyces sp. B33]MDC4232381.1 hypothetical protein [Actinomyces sp. B33]